MGDSYTVQMSTKLIKQLAGNEPKPKRKIKKSKPKTTLEREPAQIKKNQIPTPQPSSSSGSVWPPRQPPPPPMYLPIAPPPLPPPPSSIPEVEVIRAVCKESEKVVEKLERKESDMLQELNQRAKELRDKEFKLPYQNPVPCTSEREDCLRCYKENPDEPLKCSQSVKKFADCARQARQNRNAAAS